MIAKFLRISLTINVVSNLAVFSLDIITHWLSLLNLLNIYGTLMNILLALILPNFYSCTLSI